MPKRYGIKPVPSPIEVEWKILMDDYHDGKVTLYVEGGNDGPEFVHLVKGDSITMTHTVSFS